MHHPNFALVWRRASQVRAVCGVDLSGVFRELPQSSQSEQEQRAILESMAKIDNDPLLQWRAGKRINELTGVY